MAFTPMNAVPPVQQQQQQQQQQQPASIQPVQNTVPARPAQHPQADLQARIAQAVQLPTLDSIVGAFKRDPELESNVRQHLTSTSTDPLRQLQILQQISNYLDSRERIIEAQALQIKELEQRVLHNSGAPSQTIGNIAPAPADNAKQLHSAPTGGVAIPSSAPSALAPADYSNAARFEGISFSIPQRKKLTLEISPSPNGGIRAVGASGAAEFALAYSQIDHVFRLQVPEKMQAQDYYLAVPKRSLSQDQILWTANAFLPRGAPESDPTQSATHLAALEAAAVRVIQASSDDFVAAAPNPRKEPAHCTRAFKGSKEGFLFFLGTGVLFGFKKPVLHFVLRDIKSMASTTVTKHTFSLVIEAPDPAAKNTPNGSGSGSAANGNAVEAGADGEEEFATFEFSLIDQADFPGIQEYIERNSLHDGSMDQRRAKEIVEPPSKKRRREEGGDEQGGELAKAEEEAAARGAMEDDDDDDDDEDFAESDESDGGSPGESESEEEEEEEVGGGGGGDDEMDED